MVNGITALLLGFFYLPYLWIVGQEQAESLGFSYIKFLFLGIVQIIVFKISIPIFEYILTTILNIAVSAFISYFSMQILVHTDKPATAKLTIIYTIGYALFAFSV